MENFTQRNQVRLSQCGSHAHLLLVWIDCLSCRPMIHSCLQLCFVITGRTLRCVRCVFGLVNDLLSMCNVLFPEHISAVSDVGPVSIFSFIHPVFSLFFVCLTHSAFSQLLLFFFFYIFIGRRMSANTANQGLFLWYLRRRSMLLLW